MAEKMLMYEVPALFGVMAMHLRAFSEAISATEVHLQVPSLKCKKQKRGEAGGCAL